MADTDDDMAAYSGMIDEVEDEETYFYNKRNTYMKTKKATQKKSPKRLVIGSVYKGRDGNPDYIQIRKDLTSEITLEPGMFINLTSKKQRLENIEKGEKSGKLTPEFAEELRTREDNKPDFVRFELEISLEQSSVE